MIREKLEVVRTVMEIHVGGKRIPKYRWFDAILRMILELLICTYVCYNVSIGGLGYE